MTKTARSPDEPPVELQLRRSWPPEAWSDVTVLLAVSGGADSVALLRAMDRVRCAGAGRLCVAHFNHGLRGAESAADARFVELLANEWKLECVIGRADAMVAKADRDEDSARQARYKFLRATAERLGARYVVTAHTADDQAETVLHHIVRGTGLSGLAGVSRVRSLGPATTLIRPLLQLRRADLLAYLDRLGQAYRTDASNADLRYTRNRIRHELLPQLNQTYNCQIVDALCRLGQLAGDAQQVIEHLASDLADRCVAENDADRLEIDVSVLAGEKRHLVRETLVTLWRRQEWPRQSMGYAEWDLLAGMALADATSAATADRVLPGGVSASRQAGRLRLTRRL